MMDGSEALEDKLLGRDQSEHVNKDLKVRVWNESKILWRIASPAMITRVATYGILVATQSFMGHIGETELASYAVIQIFLVRFANGIVYGMASALETLCGQAFGAKHYHMMGIYLQRSWIVVLCTSVILLPVFIFTSPLLKLIGQEEELAEVAGKISIWFIPILYYFVFSMTMQKFLQAQLKNIIIGWLSTASFVIHLILSWLFVYKLSLGIPGAMGAMIISTWTMVIGEFVYIFGGWCPGTWKGFSMSAFTELWPIAKLSLSSGVMLCLELWYNAVLVLVAGYMKNAAIAISAFSICLNITTWELMICVGFLSAASVRVANELGRGDAEAAKFSTIVNLSTTLSIGVLFSVLFLVFSHVISYAFTSSAEVAKAVSSLASLLSLSVLLNSVQPVLSGVAIGAGRQTLVAYVNLASYYLAGIPIGVLLGYVANLAAKGIWIGMLCGVALQTLALLWITWRTDWKDQVERASQRLNKWLLPPSEDKTNHA
ncbi:protein DETOXIFICATION 24-like [Macadamia integrifolia]|uniref:protein DETOXIFICATION 24-like n=1 Tax=Macadamia integrifolia TaxID=60698 RepID=UPI001C4FF73D|nr:protein DETOXIFICATION 24-like [Macadamia integrifolia]XP_042502876.1 protein DETOXIFICATION 24-like [Macadamia integrifolia]XP_042502877.1 protein DETOXIFICATION 24-like [Macadamia integrifolia]XP_042502878.1 protein DETOXIFICATION 24-like [Macadamia integrifolia]XP_042502879.1 protein DETOXIFICATION 24-like [Macadamia integrifolia]